MSDHRCRPYVFLKQKEVSAMKANDVQYSFLAFGRVDSANPDVAVFTIRSMAEARVVMRSVEIQAVLVSMDLADPAAAVRMVRDDVELSYLPVVAVGDVNPDLFRLGFDDACAALDELCLEKIVAQNRRLRELHRQAYVDGLTGCLNRNAYIRRAADGPAGACVFVDLDLFKRVNDTYGHAAGDAVLAEFGAFLRRNTRDGDFVARIGGEEFVIILSGLDTGRAAQVARRLHRLWPGRVTLPDGQTVPVTFSAGVGASEAGADRALYRAKNTGRNRVCVETGVKRLARPRVRRVAIADDGVGRARVAAVV